MGTMRDGLRLYKAKRYDLALEEFLTVDSADTEGSELAYYLGLCFTKLERYDDALLYLEQVVTASPDIARAYQCRLVLAYVYSVTGRGRLAEFEIKQLLESGYESVQVFTAMGYSNYIQRRIDDSLSFYKKALAMNGENTTALNSCGYILVDEQRDIVKGLDYCKRAVLINPSNPSYMDSLGWAYFKNGETLEARTWLRRALDIAPRRKEIADHMRRVMEESE